MPYAFVVIYGIIGAPLIETALMAGWLVVVERFAGSMIAVLSSAALWGVIHGLDSIDQGLTVVWPFLIFSIAFVVWRRRGINRGLQAAASIHALYNASLFAAATVLS
nr:CPBP family glutamic-type intramembrane protease [Hephaestia mangrovi]